MTESSFQAPSFWLGLHPLILASKSLARRRLLEAAAIPVQIQPAEIEEREIEALALNSNAAPDDIARLLARAKAEHVSRAWRGRTVVGADQILCLDEEILHKPRSADELGDRMRMLSGRSHTLCSAAAVAREGQTEFEVMDRAIVTFRNLSRNFIDRYVAVAERGELKSVGGYEVEGLGLLLLDGIAGEYATVLGMPIRALFDYFRKSGLLVA